MRWYLAFLLGFPALYLVPATFWMGTEPYQALMQQWTTLLTVFLPGVLIFPAIINWGEEAGWRGFAQTHMQAQYGALRTALLVGLLHAIWHLPIFLLVEGPVALGPFDLKAFLINTILILALTMIWTWIFNGAKQSILIASLTHATFNATQNWLTMLLPHQPDQVGSAVTAIILVTSVLLIILTKGQLGYTGEQTQQTEIAA
jgi:membrane protease YdiL (CAAX protease family)